jgi:hypothetical protein
MDHLVFGVPELARGIELLESITGVRARLSGQHPGRGTHNALLSLGGRQYFEIIAVDPQQTDTSRLMFPALKGLLEPRLIAWAVAVDDIAEIVRLADSGNIVYSSPIDGSRQQSDGSMLRWKLLTITQPSIEGLPFFIEWERGTTHPSQTSPSGCNLLSFEIEHTDPETLRRILKHLRVEAKTFQSSRVALKARLHTPKGEVGIS